MRFLSSFLIIIFFYACEVKINAPGTSPSTISSKIRNGITVQSTGGVTVEQAFLTYEDGTLVDENNLTNVNRKLKLNLVIEGWKAENKNVYLEGGEQVLTSEGDILLDENKLFANDSIQSIPAENAKYIKLHVVISEMDKLYDYYKVNFHVWNKKFDQSIKGSYKFYIK